MIDISVVAPLYNEAESLGELYGRIERVMTEHGYRFEVIFVDDGSSDNSWSVIEELASANGGTESSGHGDGSCGGGMEGVSVGGGRVRGIRFGRNYGKSAALYCGFEAAEGGVVITMDADLQDSPDEIPALYDMIAREGFDMVSGWKKRRYDPLGKRLPSKFFNATARAFSGIRLHDFNCGLKAYKRRVVKSIEVYGEMHRFIPILAKRAGFGRIGEKVVEHRARKYGVSKFGWERMIKGYLDLITVTFMTRFGRSPMYFFGSLGTLMFLLGSAATIWIIVNKLVKQAGGIAVRNIADQPLFYIAIVAVILGVQLFLAGFLGELINRNSGERNKYLIDKTL